ncbi:hypothetical protein B0A48_08947 [Cryoendolithus antarcticus]|uniref:Uncharacterized protein n=1 Tax=Cryoendolithus antarcticus TaxID=1507870 RepID=A0A1V8T555_9PEZI|nr:hypothetical protein B0A48_08947 [Cryoendolithus antarcticus]
MDDSGPELFKDPSKNVKKKLTPSKAKRRVLQKGKKQLAQNKRDAEYKVTGGGVSILRKRHLDEYFDDVEGKKAVEAQADLVESDETAALNDVIYAEARAAIAAEDDDCMAQSELTCHGQDDEPELPYGEPDEDGLRSFQAAAVADMYSIVACDPEEMSYFELLTDVIERLGAASAGELFADQQLKRYLANRERLLRMPAGRQPLLSSAVGVEGLLKHNKPFLHQRASDERWTNDGTVSLSPSAVSRTLGKPAGPAGDELKLKAFGARVTICYARHSGVTNSGMFESVEKLLGTDGLLDQIRDRYGHVLDGDWGELHARNVHTLDIFNEFRTATSTVESAVSWERTSVKLLTALGPDVRRIWYPMHRADVSSLHYDYDLPRGFRRRATPPTARDEIGDQPWLGYDAVPHLRPALKKVMKGTNEPLLRVHAIVRALLLTGWDLTPGGTYHEVCLGFDASTSILAAWDQVAQCYPHVECFITVVVTAKAEETIHQPWFDLFEVEGEVAWATFEVSQLRSANADVRHQKYKTLMCLLHQAKLSGSGVAAPAYEDLARNNRIRRYGLVHRHGVIL